MKNKIEKLKRAKNAVILAHYYVPAEVQEIADYVGSTSEIIDFAKNSDSNEFIICTENGVDYQLVTDNPNKMFYYPDPSPCCADMKLNTLEGVLSVREKEDNEIIVDNDMRKGALLPLEKMLELSK